LSHYKEVLLQWQDQGYLCTSFKDLPNNKAAENLLVLRHDLDFERCMTNALFMAEIEHEIGAKATYFVRLHSDAYNPLEFKAYLTLKAILKMGHEIGLHFEAYEFSQLTHDPEAEVFGKEKRLLETALDVDIVSACEHGDYHRFESKGFQRFFERHDAKALGILHDPYHPNYFSDMKYLSDSNQKWREGCFCKHIGLHRRVHVATHPGFWFNKHYALG
jgi:hypothetical protein